jgi:hypothetical protein
MVFPVCHSGTNCSWEASATVGPSSSLIIEVVMALDSKYCKNDHIVQSDHTYALQLNIASKVTQALLSPIRDPTP